MEQLSFAFQIPANPVPNTSAVVVLSGGQDSVTCLGYALKVFETVHAVGFRYGQKHSVELEQAAKIAEMYGISYEVFDIYQDKELKAAGKKSIAFRLKFQSAEQTLKDDEINSIRDKVVGALNKKLGVEIR